MDRGDLVALLRRIGAGDRRGAGVEGANALVVRLRPAAEDRRQREAGGAKVPAADATALVGLDRDDLTGVGEEDLGPAIEVEIGLDPGLRRVVADGQVLRRDQVREIGQPQVGEVDAPEQAVPVRIVRLAGQKVIERSVPDRACRHRVDEGRGPEHLLVEVVDLAVADLEVAPDRAAQPADLGPARVAGLVDRLRVGEGFVRRKGPLAHLRIGAGRQVDPSDRGVVGQPARRRDGLEPVGIRLEGGEELVDPTVRPAVLVGRWPGAELLAVVAAGSGVRPTALARPAVVGAQAVARLRADVAFNARRDVDDSGR